MASYYTHTRRDAIQSASQRHLNAFLSTLQHSLVLVAVADLAVVEDHPGPWSLAVRLLEHVRDQLVRDILQVRLLRVLLAHHRRRLPLARARRYRQVRRSPGRHW